MADTFKMVYTLPRHRLSAHPEALKRLGMKHVICVPEQMVIDGNFPTVASPNPENPEGFYLAVDLAKANGADFILGSDPERRPGGHHGAHQGPTTLWSSLAIRPACCCWTT